MLRLWGRILLASLIFLAATGTPSWARPGDSRALARDIAALKGIHPEPAVERLLKRGPVVLPAVIQALDNPDLREGARRVVWRSPEAGRGHLIQGLRHPNSYVREVLFNSMQTRLPLKAVEVRALQKLLRERNPRVAEIACLLLAENGPGSRAAYKQLRTLRTRPQIYLKDCARKALFALDAWQARMDLADELQSADYETRSRVFALHWQHSQPTAGDLRLVLARPNAAALRLLQSEAIRLSAEHLRILKQARVPRGAQPLVAAHQLEHAILLDRTIGQLETQDSTSAGSVRPSYSLRLWYVGLGALKDLRLSDARFQKLLLQSPEQVCDYINQEKKQDLQTFVTDVRSGRPVADNARNQLLHLCYQRGLQKKPD